MAYGQAKDQASELKHSITRFMNSPSRANILHRNRLAGLLPRRVAESQNQAMAIFGIVKKLGGNWLCEGGSVSYDGKYWIATCTYAHSPDGWDQDLYTDAD